MSVLGSESKTNEDVEIRITGLRKGEKMIEELYTDEEKKNLSKIKGSRILSLKSNDVCPFDITTAIRDLEIAIERDDNEKILPKKLKDIFPSLRLHIK